jgi:glycosyltransferase involved in cell wall biosynthesis
MPGTKLRLLLVITGLQAAGAELMLFRLLKHMDRDRFELHVISLSTLDEVGPMLRAEGIRVEVLGMSGPLSMLLRFGALVQRMRAFKPDVVQTWMYHADLLGGLAARLLGVRRVVWSIRNSDLDPTSTKASTRMVVRASALVSGWVPDVVVSCSEVARKLHVAQGYAAGKFKTIPNGFELQRFKPDAAARRAIRAELGLNDEVTLVGVLGRYHPQKNHLGFVRAAADLAKKLPQVRFVMAGQDVEPGNSELKRAIDLSGMTGRFFLLGRRADAPSVMAALDVLVSASVFGEAFPNVLGEAMACGVPCVATDVGDSAQIVGDTGRIVQAGDEHALSDAIQAVLELPALDRQALGEAARRRVEHLFDLGEVVKRFESLYLGLVSE